MTAKKLEWGELWEAMDADPEAWVPTTEAMYWDMLECLPPTDQKPNSFLVGEPKSHNAGEAVYACFKISGGEVFAKHMTVRQYQGGAA